MTWANATAGSVTESRFKRSVVLIRSDFPTITRRGAGACAGCDWAGSVVDWVPAGTLLWGCVGLSCCCMISAAAGLTHADSSTAPVAMHNEVFRFVSRRGNLRPCNEAPGKTEFFHITLCLSPRLGI